MYLESCDLSLIFLIKLAKWPKSPVLYRDKIWPFAIILKTTRAVEFVVDEVVLEQVIFCQLWFFPLSHPTHAVCLYSFICHQFVI